MKVLGHSATWITTCFLNPECQRQVWAHTQGHGDFVLFDDLGWPWPIHDCYLSHVSATDSIRLTPTTIEELSALLDDLFGESKDIAAPEPVAPATNNIRRVSPEDWLGRGPCRVSGYVQDYVENRAARLTRGLGDLALQSIRRCIGNRRSQLTVIDAQMNSYTFLVDLGNVVISTGWPISAHLRAIRIPLLPRLSTAFICESLEVLPSPDS